MTPGGAPNLAEACLDKGWEVVGIDSLTTYYSPTTKVENAANFRHHPRCTFLEQEKRVSAQINELAAVARDARDYSSEQFMQWFIKEQVEEVATMSDLLRVAQRSRDVQDIEDYVVREQSGEGEDPTAPRAAGADGE